MNGARLLVFSNGMDGKRNLLMRFLGSDSNDFSRQVRRTGKLVGKMVIKPLSYSWGLFCRMQGTERGSLSQWFSFCKKWRNSPLPDWHVCRVWVRAFGHFTGTANCGFRKLCRNWKILVLKNRFFRMLIPVFLEAEFNPELKAKFQTVFVQWGTPEKGRNRWSDDLILPQTDAKHE